MKDHEKAQAAVSEWVKAHTWQLARAKTPADLGQLTEELNAELQRAGLVPVTLECGCCTLLGVEFYPNPSPDGFQFEIRPIRQPAAANVH